MKSNIEPPNTSNHPPSPSSPSNIPLSFLSLPEDIVLSCLARISRSYYPKLSIVSKSIRSLLLSMRLYTVRKELKTREECVYLGLKSPTDPCLIWYSLWIDPDHQTLSQCTIQEKRTGKLLVPVPSSYSLSPSDLIFSRIGSDVYKLGSTSSSSSSAVWVSNELIGQWREAPSMMVARKEALTCVRDGKLYVMGGCRADNSRCWAEVFDPKSQTWEPLPDPGPDLRFSPYKKLITMPGKIYVKTRKKNFLYLLEKKKWEVFKYKLIVRLCVIENVRYCYARRKCWWYDTKSKKWKVVKGLTELELYLRNDTEIGTYGGKLVIFWDSHAWFSIDETKKIWCAVILLHKSLNGEVWGQIEWVHIVRTVPESYTLMTCEHSCS